MNSVSKSPNEAPNPSAREYADDWQETVIEPLRQMRDHLHWLSVIRRKRAADDMLTLVEALLVVARRTEDRLARGEE